MRDPSRMVRQMQMRKSAVAVFGTETQSDAGAQADGDPELFNDSEFYQQFLKECFETIDPATSETTFYSLKELHAKKRKSQDKYLMMLNTSELRYFGGRKHTENKEGIQRCLYQVKLQTHGWLVDYCRFFFREMEDRTTRASEKNKPAAVRSTFQPLRPQLLLASLVLPIV